LANPLLGEALLASTASTIGDVVVTLVVGAFIVAVGLSVVCLLYFKARRWYRIIKSAGPSYDTDGLLEHRHPEHGVYYVRDWSVLKPLRGAPAGIADAPLRIIGNPSLAWTRRAF
jgi:hypothetical protein